MPSSMYLRLYGLGCPCSMRFLPQVVPSPPKAYSTCRNGSLFLSAFPYVCPEPVLVNDRFYIEVDNRITVFLPNLPSRPAENECFARLFLCLSSLSRACLGKLIDPIVFGSKRAFSAPAWRLGRCGRTLTSCTQTHCTTANCLSFPLC